MKKISYSDENQFLLQHRSKDISGMVFGRLTVVKFSHRQDRKTYWLCKCECGETAIVNARSLKAQNTKSCGCLHSEVASKTHKKPGYTYLINRKFLNYIKGAEKRKYKWDLTKEEFANLILKNCHYCGIDPSPLNGVDRFDNNQGYFKSNCVSCCKICNNSKSSMSPKEFEQWVMRIYGHLFEGDL